MNKVSVYAGDGKLIFSQYDASVEAVINSAIRIMVMNGMRDAIDADNQTELPVWDFLLERGYRVEVKELAKPIIDTSIKIVDSFPPTPDYLSFVDGDIRAMFGGTSYFSSDILMAQLIKELRKLNEVRK